MSEEKTKAVQVRKTRTPGKQTVLNRRLVLGLFAMCIAVLAGYIWNIVRISRIPSTAETDTLEIDTSNALHNDQYTIGNNPTDVQKGYFEGLTDALAAGDEAVICEQVVYSFVSDYFTWTNKDGNYDVGGLEYIYGPKMSTFGQWSRYNFYKDFDLYLNQQGRNKLIEVAEITTIDTVKAPDFTIVEYDPDGNRIDTTLPSYEVNVEWTYTKNSAAVEAFPASARFYVVNHNGRWEIAEFYDLISVQEWESTHSSGTE